MITPDGGLLEGAIQALHLAVGPGMSGLGQAMYDALFAANAVETVPSGQQLLRLGRDLHRIVGQDGVPPVRQLVQHPPQKFGGPDALGAGVEFGKGDFARAVNQWPRRDTGGLPRCAPGQNRRAGSPSESF